ncbi:hypothetical protein GpartN1_g7235.t1 [Galdieria partita]|uniref:GP-PDE domain-containing protein n=1 Tax=Galdieria partita TaxID=83374 RepID=A0A9C7UTM3_9RHOD|nr:hypothetical protein GpartN1_g7235.t1 [Galdieria partita]
MQPVNQSYMLCLFPGSFRENLSPLKLRLLPNPEGLDYSSLYWKLRGPNDTYYVNHDELCSKRGLYFYSFSDTTLESLDIHIDIMLEKGDSSSSCCIVGQCALVSSEFMDTKGLIRRPIVSKDIAIVGEVVFEYLIVRPWVTGLKDIRECLDTIPKLSYTSPLLVGHRGKGAHSKSYVQENTLLSFLSATHDKRVKFIELDVQLSADGQPIVFHDFLITRKTQQLDLDDMDTRKIERFPTIAVGSLSLKEFQRMAIYREGAQVTFYDSDHETREGNGYHLRSKASHGGRRGGRSHSNSSSRSSSITSDLSGIASHRSSDSDRDEMEEFPSLIEDHLPSLYEVLTKMPVEVGFFLEMKYPCPEYQQRKKLVVPDRNVFVDAVLDCVCKSFVEKKQRTIVFLSFDPDICYLLKCKQKYFEVLLLCSETRFSSDDHFDVRTTTIENAVKWSIYHKLDGMAILSDILFEKSDIVSELKCNGLKVFCFGAINSQEDKAKKLIELGVDGLIADNVTCLAKKLSEIL